MTEERNEDIRLDFISEEDNVRVFFDPSLAGKRATCEGGSPAGGNDKLASRETYVGVLTGRRLEEGDPPWKWLEMEVDVPVPDTNGVLGTIVWCEESFVFLDDEDD
jgi:hypothetical protein